MPVKMIEEEYWSIQYLTQTAGGRGQPTWWPSAGEGMYGSREAAREAMESTDGMSQFRHYRTLRVIRIVRRIEYGKTWERDTGEDG